MNKIFDHRLCTYVSPYSYCSVNSMKCSKILKNPKYIQQRPRYLPVETVLLSLFCRSAHYLIAGPSFRLTDLWPSWQSRAALFCFLDFLSSLFFPSDAVMAESETPKVTTPIARTSRRARLRNWSIVCCLVLFPFLCNFTCFYFLKSFLYCIFLLKILTHSTKLK